MQVRHIIAGEFPPQAGGVSDYTAILAVALAEIGDHSHIWTGGDNGISLQYAGGVQVHPCAGHFDWQHLKGLDARLNGFSGRRQLLVQYVPHAFGYKAMNWRFAWWVCRRARRYGDDVRIMFHEVAYPWVRKPLVHNLIACINELMASWMARAASKIYVSTTAWKPRLIRLGATEEKIVSLPIPSNIPEATDLQTVQRIRAKLLGEDAATRIVGHFGTYGSNVWRYVEPMLTRGLQTSDMHFHLIGGGGDRIRDSLADRWPQFSKRISATGRISALDVADHIRACDVMWQPFADGANTRRTSLMACLINRRATVSTTGHNCEKLWEGGAMIRLVDVQAAEDAVCHLRQLANDQAAQQRMGETAYAFYQQHFALPRTIETLCK